VQNSAVAGIILGHSPVISHLLAGFPDSCRVVIGCTDFSSVGRLAPAIIRRAPHDLSPAPSGFFRLSLTLEMVKQLLSSAFLFGFGSLAMLQARHLRR